MVLTGEREPATQETLTMKSLLEAGVHFGHQTQRWHPRMKQYIFAQRNGIHIIDLQQSMFLLERARRFITQVVEGGETVLFVGTKRQAQDSIELGASRCEMFYIKQRWLGGMLTNFPTIQSRIDHLVRCRSGNDEYPRIGLKNLEAGIGVKRGLPSAKLQQTRVAGKDPGPQRLR